MSEKRALTQSEKFCLLHLQPTRKQWCPGTALLSPTFRCCSPQMKGRAEMRPLSKVEEMRKKMHFLTVVVLFHAVLLGWSFNGQARAVQWSCHAPCALGLSSIDFHGSCIGHPKSGLGDLQGPVQMQGCSERPVSWPLKGAWSRIWMLSCIQNPYCLSITLKIIQKQQHVIIHFLALYNSLLKIKNYCFKD